MEALIEVIEGPAVPELLSLSQWLQRSGALRGKVRAVTGPPGETELGGAFELISVALTGGTGAALAGGLGSWLQSRRSNVRIRIKVGELEAEAEVGRSRDLAKVEQLLRDALASQRAE